MKFLKTMTRRSFIDNWTPFIAKNKFSQIPNLLIVHTGDLGITPIEFVLLVGLIKHRWDINKPYPSLVTLGRYCGKSRNTMQAAARSLERKGLLRRVFRDGKRTNEYDFKPLIKRLESYSQVIEKPTRVYRKTDNNTYRKLDTKKDSLKNTQLVISRKSCGKPTPIKDILPYGAWP